MVRDGTIAMGRALALFVGLFDLLNILGEGLTPGFDANLWWIDLRSLPAWLAKTILVACGTLFIAFAIQRSPGRWIRTGAILCAGLLLLASVWNIFGFYQMVWTGRLHAAFPVPFSGYVCLAAAWVLTAAILQNVSPYRTVTQRRTGWIAAGLAWCVCLLGMPLAQMFSFGLTDYRRPADAIVVFGAKVYSNGRVSSVVEERVTTACDLYLRGLAPRVILSGGPGRGNVHETEGMRRLAVSLGVPDAAIELDTDGINTQATVVNTASLFERLGVRRVLVVSHFYHLPRVKLTYRRAGWEVYTVPATSRYRLVKLPWFMTREIAALWAYYVRPLTAG